MKFPVEKILSEHVTNAICIVASKATARETLMKSQTEYLSWEIYGDFFSVLESAWNYY